MIRLCNLAIEIVCRTNLIVHSKGDLANERVYHWEEPLKMTIVNGDDGTKMNGMNLIDISNWLDGLADVYLRSMNIIYPSIDSSCSSEYTPLR